MNNRRFLFIWLIIFSILSANTAFAEATPTYMAVCINDDVAIVNGTKIDMAKPLLVLNKTYVDLYETCNFLGIKVNYIEDTQSYFQINIDGQQIDFKPISYHDELLEQHKYFVKDNTIYVQLRELSDLTGNKLYFDDWITVITKENINKIKFDKKAFDNSQIYDTNQYIYDTYPYQTKLAVYPYIKYSYEYMMGDAENLAKMYPDIIKTSSIGQSVEGRELLLVELGKGPKKIFVCGTHHAREYISTTYLMYAIDRYAYQYKTGTALYNYNIKDILNKVTFCILPMVNPDGVNLVQNGLYSSADPDTLAEMPITEGKQYGYAAWKANISGVDINWNYDYMWEQKSEYPASTGFNGYSANSEPETQAVSEYVHTEDFQAFLSFHTQGQVYYWADDKENPTGIGDMVRKDTGFMRISGTASGLSCSFFNYVYDEFGKATMTIELCPYVGNYPYPDEKFDTVFRPARNIMLIFGKELMKR